jgi:O-antigen ligase
MSRLFNQYSLILRVSCFLAFLTSLVVWCPLQFSLLTLVVVATGIAWWIKRRHGDSSPALSIWVILFLTPIAPVFGRGALLTVLYFVLALEGGAPPSVRGFAWCLPYVALLMATALVGLGPTDLYIFTETIRSIADLRAAAPAFGMDGLFDALLVVGAALVCDRVARSTLSERGIVLTLGLVASIGALSAGLQSFHATGSWVFPNQTHFWEIQSRFAGTSSDPNAAAVLSFLLLPPLVWLAFNGRVPLDRAAAMFAMISLTIGAWLSGSRTWFIAVGVSAIVFPFLTGRRKLVWGFVAAGGIAVAGVTVLDGLGLLRTELLNAWGAPSGVIRAINAASVFQISDTFAARNLFLRLAVEVASDNPIFGVGPGSFIRLVPTYQRILEMPDSRWVDNANNFYLQVAAELGVAGIVLLGITVWLFRHSARDANRSDMANAYWCSILSLGAALWFGPHLQFEECALCAAVIGGLLLRGSYRRTAPVRERPLIPSVTVAIVLLAVLVGGRRERGIFSPESDDHGGWWRWTTERAELDLICSCDGRAEAQFAIMHATRERPVEVIIHSAESGERIVDRFERPRVVQRTLQCGTAKIRGRLNGWAPMLRTTVVVHPAWQPSPMEGVGDRRWLGVRLRGSQPAYRWRECRNS